MFLVNLFVAIYRDCELIPWFINHYRRLGISGFHCVVNKLDRPDLVEQVERLSGGLLRIGAVVDEPYLAKRMHALHLNALKDRRVQPGEWCLKVDLDEFIEPPASLDELTQTAAKAGQNVCVGHFFDRVAQDGSFPDIVVGAPLNEQFPLGGLVTQKLLGGVIRKAFLFVGSECPITDGQHILRNERPLITSTKVHHFKWRSGVIDRCNERMNALRAAGAPWWCESERFLAHVAKHGGKIDVSNPFFELQCVKSAPKFECDRPVS